MSTVNLNDTVPAAPANFNNLKWQSDASGNISAYDPGGTWTSWTPTVGGGSMTATTKTLNDAQYLRSGPVVFFKLNIEVNLSGTAGGNITASLPIPPVGYSSAVSCELIITAGTGSNGWFPGYGAVSGAIQMSQAGGGNFPVPSSYLLQVAGFYRCA